MASALSLLFVPFMRGVEPTPEGDDSPAAIAVKLRNAFAETARAKQLLP